MGHEQSLSNHGFYTPNGGPVCKVSSVPFGMTMELDSMLREISDEIDASYQAADRGNVAKAAAAHVDVGDALLSFVPAQNQIQKIAQRFMYEKELGRGASCRVLLVTDKLDEETQYALKELPKITVMNRWLFAQEYRLINMLKGHPNILSFHSCYIDRSCYYIATQFCSGGTMLDRIQRQKYFNEQQCSEFMRNVLFGLEHMHKHHVVHRDIKCDNLIFDKTGKDGVVKIIDFGNSELITDPNAIDKSLIGSLYYFPPELLQIAEPRTKASLYKGDMWALGVVCYILVTGKLPFYGKNKEQTLKSIKRCTYDWPHNIKLSDQCKDFISQLLEKDIGKRMSVDEALKHDWISDANAVPNINFGDDHFSRIRLLLRANKLQKVLLDAILSEMDKKEQPQLQALVGNEQISEHDIINYILCHGKITQAEKSPTSDVAASQSSAKTLGAASPTDDSECFDCKTDDVDDDDSKEELTDSFLPETYVSKRMSVERFETIMRRTSKKYDVSTLVEQLDPSDSGFIPLRRISGFHGLLHSEDSNNIRIDSFVQSGLAALDDVDNDE